MPEEAREKATAAEMVSIISLKQLAMRMLKPTSTLRALIISEPDYLPKMVTFGKIDTWVQLLYKELGAGEADDRLLVRQR